MKSQGPEGLSGPGAALQGTPSQGLASQLGVTPETLSRALRQLQDAGVLQVEGRRITLLGGLPAGPSPAR